MKVCVIGTGYVGLVAGVCLADLGHRVVCVDIDQAKVDALRKGTCPIYEPGLEPLLQRNLENGRLAFTTETAAAVAESEVVFIAVGTPEADDGMADLSQVKKVAEAIGRAMNGEKVIVNKSTVPVGTAKTVRAIIARHYDGPFQVVSNPEFLREGHAVQDFLKPDRVVLGVEDARARSFMEELYAPLHAPVLVTDVASAEMIKYASNAFLALKISFINQVARLCEKTGADVQAVAKGMGMDRRIGPHFLQAGAGWGGSCFPKDVRALARIGKQHGVPMTLCEEAYRVNEEQKKWMVDKIRQAAGGSLKGKTVTLLGLAFKPDTDDLRNASALAIARGLLKEGARVHGVDPVAEEAARRRLPALACFDNPYQALEGADVLVLVTEWEAFRGLDFARVKKLMKTPAVVDGRNLYDRGALEKMGFAYTGVGR